MSGFENGSINLDEERDIYYAGQILSGKLEFGLNQALDFRAIKLIFHGEASVYWDEEEVEEYEGVQATNTVEYTGQEVFFHVEQCICGGVGVSQLQPGGHVIPFRFQVPATVPSSFADDDDDEERRIIYYVKAVLEYHDGRETEELYQPFGVVVPLDLNINPEMQDQNELTFEEVLSSCCCGSGLLQVAVCLPATGFCPGMTVPVSVKVDNQSSVEVTKIMFELVQRVKYSSTNPPSKKEEPENSLNYSKTGAIPSTTRRNFEHGFEIPDLIPVITQNCNIVKVGYFFKVKVNLSGCNDALEDEMEIALGLIPIRGMVDDYRHPLQNDLPQGPIPKPGEPPAIIQPYIYPSNTLQVVNNYSAVNAYPNYQTPGYPGNPPSNAPYPGAVPAYPGANSYPNAVHPGNNTYPSAKPPIPSANPSYPGANPPYPGASPRYPGSNPPYPGANPPYPGANPPYPSANPPYPTPAPANPVIGFVAGGAPYPSAAGAPPPFNPSAPPQ